jgi:8-oxo-dGTP diphosphatase
MEHEVRRLAIPDSTYSVTSGIDVRTLRLAAALVVHDERFLIVRRSMRERFLPGAWGIPCGKLEPDESPGDGALRELKEETGLLGLVLYQVDDSTFSSEWHGAPTHNVQNNFLVRPLTLDITLPEPDQTHAWWPFDQLAEAPVDAYNRAVISNGLASLRPAYALVPNSASTRPSRSR